MSDIVIQLIPALSRHDQQVLAKYLTTPSQLTRVEWTMLYDAVDLLRASHVTLFLFVARSFPLRHDFYITRLWDAQRRQYRRVVILSPTMWATINGETIATEFAQLLKVIPQPARFDFADGPLIALGYGGVGG